VLETPSDGATRFEPPSHVTEEKRSPLMNPRGSAQFSICCAAQNSMRPSRLSLPLLILFLALLPPVAFARDHPLAPDFTLPTGSGTVSLHEFRGKVVYLDFWASWCSPCRRSFPWMSSMLDRYGDHGLVILSVNLDKDREAANGFLREFQPSFIVAFDPAGKTAVAFRVDAMPSSVVVGRNGDIVYSHEGFQPSKTEEIENHIKEALSK
jgi:cytochrome c biogenesis protein CcmG, thiol:disulfide interchange protein DsbE